MLDKLKSVEINFVNTPESHPLITAEETSASTNISLRLSFNLEAVASEFQKVRTR